MNIGDIIKSEGLPAAAGIPIGACRIKKQYLLDMLDFKVNSVYLSVIPYYSHACDLARTVSAYAVPRDYHLYISELEGRLKDKVSALMPGTHIAVYGDHSPIDEVHAAASAGLGVIGENRLLITERFSSYVFIFGVFTDAQADTQPSDPHTCEGCGACRSACPAAANGCLCLSELTQKKGELSPDEERILSRYGLAWGCDICQEVCPHTAAARKSGTLYTDIGWFTENTVPAPSAADIAREGFLRDRAYSWRGPQPILRNLEITEKKHD